ncbi:MAG: hypothetical protein KKB38_13280 [Gammaproteobacteria bacterium]|nr:hypothetical protein [Gammaproteobacteria bacterium]
MGLAVGNTVNAVGEATGNAMDGKGFAVDDSGATNAGSVGDMALVAPGPAAGAAAPRVTGQPKSQFAVLRQQYCKKQCDFFIWLVGALAIKSDLADKVYGLNPLI